MTVRHVLHAHILPLAVV